MKWQPNLFKLNLLPKRVLFIQSGKMVGVINVIAQPLSLAERNVNT